MADAHNSLIQNPVALTIAGSDSGAGAGVQADLKTFAAHGIYGVNALTLVTTQNTQAVRNVFMLPVQLIKSQLDALFADFRITAVKTGALGCPETIFTVADFLARHPAVPLVVDPVMISKHGHALLGMDGISGLKSRLLPLAAVVTPNLSEAAVLSNAGRIETRAEMLRAADSIAHLGCRCVVIKGGHLADQPADLVWHNGQAHWLEGARIDTPHTHGTGCTFSAAIVANLVKGLQLVDAISAAKDYITGSLRHVQAFGRGINPVNHFWQSDPQFGVVE